ncbi:hypothetical protein KC367_g137 [Hortaea werneckii]|nr:hypothetical protein KC367_g137 [Hortaea werneckii]
MPRRACGLSSEQQKKTRSVRQSKDREQMKLSRNARWVEAKKSGHHVQLQEPDLVADEIGKIVADARLSSGDRSDQSDRTGTLSFLDRSPDMLSSDLNPRAV